MNLEFDEQGKPRVTDNDVWSVLVRKIDSPRVTVVGPYHGIAGLHRAKSDCKGWETDDRNVRTAICRMMHPVDYDRVIGLPDGLYGYSANLWKRFRAFMTGVNPPKEEE